MSNIHIPIEETNLLEVVPEGEEILYSVNCRAEFIRRGKNKKWLTPVLVTKTGFASFTRLKKFFNENGEIEYVLRDKKQGLIPTFTPWVDLGLGISKKKTPFVKNRIVHVISNFKWLHYIDLQKTKLGDFCRDLWRYQNEL